MIDHITALYAARRAALQLRPMSIQEDFEQAVRDHRAGRMQQADALYRAVLAQQPEHADALCGLGFLAAQSGQADKAEELIRLSVALRPDDAQYPLHLGLLLSSLGKWEAAVAAFAESLRLDPKNPTAHFGLANALQSAGRLDESAASYQRAISLRPDYFQAYNNLGVVQQSRADAEAAIAAYRRAIALRPDHPEPHNNLGVVLQEQGQTELAIASYRQALTLRADYPQAHNNLANSLKQIQDVDAAIDEYDKAIALEPRYAEAHNNLANALKDAGRLDEAIDHFRKAMALRPQDAAIHSNWLFALQFHPDWDAAALLREHRIWDQKHAQPLARMNPPRRAPGSAARLRIGYVSPDFKDHCQSFFTLPLLQNHDRRRFEIFCFSSVARPDAITHKLRGSVEQWRDVANLPDEQLAEMVREDGIDILVDLTLHMGNGRLLTFARKPAPVQATWLAYPGTSGLAAMDYRLTDPYLDPPGQTDPFYSERSIRLADSFWCYQPIDGDVAVNPLPALDAGHFTFGCLNNFCKVNRDVLESWAAVLRAVSGSHLLLLAPRGRARQRVTDTLGALGVEPSRVEFVDRQPRAEYFRMYHRIDLGLDTFPYNGHTTSLDSLWMGVPVITRIGATAVGRGGWSQLNNLALSELAAHSTAPFVEIACKWASDLPRLARLRASLRDLMLGSALCDGSRFARNIETAFGAMWEERKD